MSFFVQPTSAPRPKTKNIQAVSLVLATILLGMVVAQLFTFERFPDVIMQMGLTGDSETFATLLSALVVTVEVAALPFLLFMSLSRAARVVSMAAGWLAVAWWIVASVGLNVSGAENSGLLGATFDIPAGLWTIFFSLALAVAAGWAAWGMWPLKQKDGGTL